MRKIKIREVSKEQAREEIIEFFKKLKKGRIVYWSDIEIKLRLDYGLVQEICEELLIEGLIHEAEDPYDPRLEMERRDIK